MPFDGLKEIPFWTKRFIDASRLRMVAGSVDSHSPSEVLVASHTVETP